MTKLEFREQFENWVAVSLQIPMIFHLIQVALI